MFCMAVQSVKNWAVLFTFRKFHGIIQQLDKLEFGGDGLNPSTYIPIIVLWIIIFIMFRNRRKVAIIRKIIKKRKLGENTEMKEFEERFIDKDCVIYSFDGNHQYVGIIKEVTDGAILVENGGKIEALNLDFVSRIREYPKNKNGKKKSVVLD